MTAAIRLVDPRPVEHALSETSSAAPPWGIHTGDLEHTESAALAFDLDEPDGWPRPTEALAYANGYADGRSYERHASASREFRRTLWGALAGFSIALLMVVGGCAVIAALERPAVARVTSGTTA